MIQTTINERRARQAALEAQFRKTVAAQLAAWERWKSIPIAACKSMEYREARAEWEYQTRSCGDLALMLGATHNTTRDAFNA